jgi:hypothetical protein
MFAIEQTADGLLSFSSPSHNIYRFDGIRFVPWPLPYTFRPTALNLGDDRNARHVGGHRTRGHTRKR